MCERANKRTSHTKKNTNKRNKHVRMYTTQDNKHTQKQTYTKSTKAQMQRKYASLATSFVSRFRQKLLLNEEM